ncbi:MAG: YicC/YloC family endoribonuclease [Rhodocyclaceae bacterium]|jgi:uncharacterized protein (TIGR00255 family)
MILSMTGYAAASRDVGRGVLHLEIRSVNSRFLDLGFRIGDELRTIEPQLRELIAGRVQRGKVECRLNLLSAVGTRREATLSQEVLQQLRHWQTAVTQAFPEAPPLSVGEILHWPGMLGEEALPPDIVQSECLALASSVLNEMLASRRREGEKLAAMIRERVTRMRQLVAQVEPKLPILVSEYQEKLALKLREALASADEERIRQEVGLFAARIDVAEELSRLTAHLDEVTRVLDRGGAAGKRLDFLMQELNREANTLASKAVAVELTNIALELKLLVEQMREQVQNLE